MKTVRGYSSVKEDRLKEKVGCIVVAEFRTHTPDVGDTIELYGPYDEPFAELFGEVVARNGCKVEILIRSDADIDYAEWEKVLLSDGTT